jgi:hypothetical protein
MDIQVVSRLLKITLVLTLLAASPLRAAAGETDEARSKLLKAIAKTQTVRKHRREIERKYVPPEITHTLLWWANIGRALVEKKVSYQWTFP